jgi:hypothetical protein
MERNIFLLPAENKSSIGFRDGSLIYRIDPPICRSDPFGNYGNADPQYVYIVNNEKIKERDWFLVQHNIEGEILSDKMILCKADHNFMVNFYMETLGSVWYKVILTNDEFLITDGIQEINDNFLESYVKNPTEKIEIYATEICTYCGQEHCDNRECRGYIDEKIYIPVIEDQVIIKTVRMFDGYEISVSLE